MSGARGGADERLLGPAGDLDTSPVRRSRPDRITVVLVGLIGVLLASAVTLLVLSEQVSDRIEKLGTQRLAAYHAAWEIRYLDEVLTHSAARYAASGDP